MKRVAVVVSGASIHRTGGIHSVAMARYERLLKNPEIDTDIFFIRDKYMPFSIKSLLKGEQWVEKDNVEGHDVFILTKVEYRSDCRFIRKPLKIYHRCTRQRVADWRWQHRLGVFLKDYDLVTAHFNDAALAAEGAWKRYGIPYCVTWHGSDIHTIPMADEAARVATISAMEHASCNFFVSRHLMQLSDSLTVKGRKEVLYNGIDDIFVRYGEQRRHELREQFDVEGKKVITFAGSLKEVKNADLLPEVFRQVSTYYNLPLEFWICGDGPLRTRIEQELQGLDISCRMWGSCDHEKMPDIFNVTDVLVLPSKNEGLGLVALEALSCGANVVGSRVGGIPEAIGEEYCVSLDENFVNQCAEKIVDLLESPQPQKTGVSYSWDESAIKEQIIYRQIM